MAKLWLRFKVWFYCRKGHQLYLVEFSTPLWWECAGCRQTDMDSAEIAGMVQYARKHETFKYDKEGTQWIA